MLFWFVARSFIMAFFLAIDGGGTKTRCRVADESSVLAESAGETVKIMSVGETLATERLQELVLKAAQESGINPGQVERTCIGLAGSSSEQVRTWAHSTLRGLVSGEILLFGDEEIALDAAFHGAPGILIVAGTGSNVIGRCSNGTSMTVGGWGPLLGDEGSGYWIGLEALRAGLRAHDPRVDSCLLVEIMAFWKLRDLGELVAMGNQHPRPNFAELTKVVTNCASRGDALAMSVLERAGEELATQIRLIISKMQDAGCEPGDLTHVAFTGSVLAEIAVVRRSMESSLRASLLNLEIAMTPVEPLDGALWHARRGY
jgi:N-acetylglucosamine kinase-like BadF-type ATPase